MMVVLPVPGPPVITITLFSVAHFMASTCFFARVIASCFCTHSMALCELIFLMDLGAFIKVFKRLAILLSDT